jgi:hypothetical protein
VRRVVDHLLFLLLGPVPSFSADIWLLGKLFGEIFDIDIYPLVSVIIFCFLRFPLINLPEQFLSFTTNSLSPFDSDPFDTRYSYRISLPNPSIEHPISSFPSQFYLLLPCYLLVKLNLEEKARFCKL